MSRTGAEREDETLVKILFIYYPIWFKKDKNNIKVLLDSNSELNTITLAYTSKLDLYIRCTNMGMQNINGSTLTTFEIVKASCQI